MSHKKSVVIHSQSREIIYNVFQFMKEEKERGDYVIPLSKLKDRVAKATGVGLTTLKKIIKEASSKAEGSKFTSPRKTIKKPSPRTSVDEFDEEVIRRVIYTYADIHKKRPTMSAILEELKDANVNFSGKLTSLRSLVRKLGFRWKKTQDNMNILMEKPEIRSKRVEFLRKLKKYKEEGKEIIYTDETYLHNTHTSSKCWQDGTDFGPHAPIGKGKRLVMVHGGGRNGFVPNALLIFKSGCKSGDYHDDMNHANYTQWLTNQLIPNLPKNSVLVIDNASYHNVLVEKNPTTSWKKSNMQEWLMERAIFFEQKETKSELYAKILMHKPLHKTYVIDQMLAKHGHVVLRLPPYHPELNPIEKIWALVKSRVAACNVTFKLDDVWKLAAEKFDGVEVKDWEKICDHVSKIESEYLAREHVIDDVEDLVITINTGSSDEDCSSSDDEDLGCEPLE